MDYGAKGPRFESRWELCFFLFLFSFNQWGMSTYSGRLIMLGTLIAGDAMSLESLTKWSTELLREFRNSKETSATKANVFQFSARESNPELFSFVFSSTTELDHSEPRCSCLEKRVPNFFDGVPWFGHPTSIPVDPSASDQRIIGFRCFVFASSSHDDDVTVVKDGNVVWKRSA